MATIKKKHMGEQQFGGFTPYGNVTALRATLLTIATGAVHSADTATPLAVGDKVYLELLPQGYLLDDASVTVSQAFSAGVTGDLGIEYVDGVSDAGEPHDPAYFGAALVLDAVGRLRASGTKAPVKLAKEAYLVLTIKGAANAKAARLDVVVTGERFGPK